MLLRSALAAVLASLVLVGCQSGGGSAPGAYEHANETHAEAIRRIEREGAEMRRRSGTP
jgi:hypothetical protein